LSFWTLAKALDRADRVTYALAICDMKMPDLDGEHFYLAPGSRQNPLHERFLFVTGGLSSLRVLATFWSATTCPMWQKPFRVEELTDKNPRPPRAIPPLEPSRTLVTKK